MGDARSGETDTPSTSSERGENLRRRERSPWAPRVMGGWLRAVIVVWLAAATAAGLVDGVDISGLTVVAVVLAMASGVAILVNPVDPDRNSAASLALLFLAQLCAAAAGGESGHRDDVRPSGF